MASKRDITFTIEVHAEGESLVEAYQALSDKMGDVPFNPTEAWEGKHPIHIDDFSRVVVEHRSANGMCRMGIHCEGCEVCRG